VKQQEALVDCTRVNMPTLALSELALRYAQRDKAVLRLDPAGRVPLKQPHMFLPDEYCGAYKTASGSVTAPTQRTMCNARALEREDSWMSVYVHQRSFMNISRRGLRHGPDAAAGQLALTTATAIALEDNGAATRWVVGESVFSNTRLPARNNSRRDTT
jgi:hypothetical protein